jgi:hypothetical protein
MKKPTPFLRALGGLGIVLLGIAITLGSVIGVSFWTELVFEQTFGSVVSEAVVLQNGAVAVTQTNRNGWRAVYEVSAWQAYWRDGGNGLEVNIPLWPLPMFLAVAGVLLRMLGASGRDNVRSRHGRAMRRMAFLLAPLGNGLLAIIVMSFMTVGGFGEYYSDRSGSRQLGMVNGVFLFSRVRPASASPFVTGLITPRWVSPWSAWYGNRGGVVSLGAPVWPVPMGVLGAAAWCKWRSGRARRLMAIGRCGACGYPRGSSAAACPECGEDGQRLVSG